MTAVFAALLVLAAHVAPAEPVNAAQLDSVIRRTVTDKHLVGFSVGIMQDGKIVLAKGYGV
jgi:CubicO group peptidase (beta-lactamase class C family)